MELWRELLRVWAVLLPAATTPSVAATLHRVVLPMVQAVQQLVRVLPQTKTWQSTPAASSSSNIANCGISSTASAAGYSSSSISSNATSSSSNSRWLEKLCGDTAAVQALAAVMAESLVFSDCETHAWHASDDVATMALQVLAAYCITQGQCVNMEQHDRQHPHHQAVSRSAVPGLPDGVVQLQPCCQEYCAAAVRASSVESAKAAAFVLVFGLVSKCNAAGQPGQSCNLQSPAVSAGAVQLVTHMVLLAGSKLQHALGQHAEAG